MGRRLRSRQPVGLRCAIVQPHRPPRLQLLEVPVNAPDKSRFAGQGIAVSPDGRHIAFIATSRIGWSLWVRSLEQLEPREIPDTIGARGPFWSPDSKTIGYFQDRNLKTVPINGVSPHSDYGIGLATDPGVAKASSCSARSGRAPCYSISAKGGKATRVTVPTSKALGDRWPWFLDDGQHFLYLTGDTSFELRVGSLTPAPAEIIGPFESNAAYGAGYLFFVRGGNLMAQRFDPDNRKLLGDPMNVVGERESNLTISAGCSPCQRPAHSCTFVGTGQIAADVDRPKWLSSWQRLAISVCYFNSDLSPDEHHLAVSRMTEQDGRSEFDIWTIEIPTGIATRLTDDYPAWQFDPTWSPDGNRLAFNEKLIPTSRPVQVIHACLEWPRRGRVIGAG